MAEQNNCFNKYNILLMNNWFINKSASIKAIHLKVTYQYISSIHKHFNKTAKISLFGIIKNKLRSGKIKIT